MIGSKLRQLRLQKGLTLDELAKASSVSRGNIHRIELDQISPRIDTLHDLCAAMDTSLSAFFRREETAREEHGPAAGPRKGFRSGVQAWLEHAEALIRYSADSLSVLDDQGYVVYESDPALRFHAGRPDERRGQPWWATAHPDDRDALRERFQSFLAGGGVSPAMPYRAAHADGTWHSVRTRLSRQVDHPLIQGIIASTQDVTLLLQLEEVAQNHRKYESLATALGGVTHTFSNLLMGIHTTNEIIIRSGKLEGSNRAHVDKVQAAILKAGGLLRQMREFAGNPLLFVEPLALNQLIRSLAPTLEPCLQPGQMLGYELDDSIPVLEVDRKLLEQILIALVTNAGDSVEGAGLVTLRTRRGRADGEGPDGTWIERGPVDPADCLVLEVQDTGCGMDPAVLQKICDPFYTTRFQGQGMGLASVVGIVRAHQGGLRVLSDKGRGSCFQVFLPAAPRPAVAIPEGLVAAEPRSAKGILLAEDDPFLRESIREMLEALGYDHILEAGDGQEAIRLYDAHADAIGLVLLDVDMPSMGGIETYGQLRERNASLRIVFSTGAWERHPELVRHTAHGITGILCKPFQQHELKALLQFYLK
jgi:PAS domain S-box-containing protein